MCIVGYGIGYSFNRRWPVGRRKLPDGKKRDFVVMVRFQKNVKALVEGAFEASGESTLSGWIRRIVWEEVKRFEAQAKMKADLRQQPASQVTNHPDY